MDTARFNVAQTALVLQSVINRNKSSRCEILQIMPFDGKCFQYRVRCEHERFDRIAQEHELAEITPLQTKAAQLDERRSETKRDRTKNERFK
ncbi:hypothetical protein G5V57_26675 [Nordella sp. HKS 07]|uniref:hypothetical protein n=1 Tax=Nordella sp. HKS 07 TaxID=2712222 RepID=UPI0013E19193|nr:hypothetical protein [Nordella sp. HKS 07]QIG50998.1 hypothetical protein G5V57_26675 [Nordella sp. HKS 07]